MIKNYLDFLLGEINYHLKNDSILIKIPLRNGFFEYNWEKYTEHFEFDKSNRVSSNNLNYLDDYGIQYENYFEIFIYLVPNDIEFIDDSFLFDVNFTIDEILLNTGPPSDLFNFINYPLYYRDYKFIYEKGFDEFCFTLKFTCNDSNYFADLANKALYYINSICLSDLEHKFRIGKLISNPSYYEEEHYLRELSFKLASTKIKRKRLSDLSIEPVKLYNYAIIQDGYNKFLNLYKILEYYFSHIQISFLEKYRYDKNISTEDLYNKIKPKEEEKLLNLLLEEVLEMDDYERFKYILSNHLSAQKPIKNISNAIYEFRNSLVHTKVSQINRSIIPEIYPNFNDLNIYNLILQEVVETVIAIIK